MYYVPGPGDQLFSFIGSREVPSKLGTKFDFILESKQLPERLIENRYLQAPGPGAGLWSSLNLFYFPIFPHCEFLNLELKQLPVFERFYVTLYWPGPSCSNKEENYIFIFFQRILIFAPYCITIVRFEEKLILPWSRSVSI